MGLKTLDERQKLLAEELLKGIPRTQIAEKLGVHRSTLYEWMKDPLWQQYFTKLADDLDEARSMRLLVTVMKAAEMTELYMDFVIGELQSKDRDRIQELPGLDTITTALKRLADLQRSDAVAAPGAKAQASADAKVSTKEASTFTDLLDRLVEGRKDEGQQH